MGIHFTSSYYGRKIDKRVSEWLYGDWDETKLNRFKTLYAIPGVHDYFDYLLDKRADEEYLSRYGMSYQNIHDPRKLLQSGSSSRMIGTGYRMVSRNVDSLYRSAVYRPRGKKKRH